MKYILFLYHQYEINHLLLPPSPDDEDTLFSYAQVYGICFFTGCGVVVLPVSRKISVTFYKLT